MNEVKELSQWEYKQRGGSLGTRCTHVDFYIFKLTNKIQNKIMKDDKEPTINLRNINYINTVERYQRKAKGSFDFLAPTSVRSSGLSITGDAAKDYYEKHQYMMRDRMCELFIKNESIPLDDKKQIEFWFNQEYKELNASLKEIKETMRKHYAESNDLYNEIERLVDEIQVTHKRIK